MRLWNESGWSVCASEQVAASLECGRIPRFWMRPRSTLVSYYSSPAFSSHLPPPTFELKLVKRFGFGTPLPLKRDEMESDVLEERGYLGGGWNSPTKSTRDKVSAQILPSTAYLLRLKSPPVREMIDAGVPVALGSDFNPNCPVLSLPACMNMAPRAPERGGGPTPQAEPPSLRALPPAGGGGRAVRERDGPGALLRAGPGGPPVSGSGPGGGASEPFSAGHGSAEAGGAGQIGRAHVGTPGTGGRRMPSSA